MSGPVHARRGLALVAAVAAVSLLSGCLQWFLPPEVSSTSSPTMEDVPAELEPYYHQVLQWEPCGSGMQCTTATAPMDWSDPGGEDIELALVRHPATGQRLGSLLVNPGGPGGSGYDFILDSVDYATDVRLQSAYDIVGFDPRGVGRSSAVTCYDRPSQLDAYLYDVPDAPRGSDAWVADTLARGAALAEACRTFTGPLLEFVDTESAARDLDLLRAVLGDPALNYLGYSYGSLLGATYAGLFPERTGRMVLDGAIDPAATEFDVTLEQAKGFESALEAYLTSCVQGSDCPFDGTVEQAMDDVRALLDALDESPLTAADGRRLGSGAMFWAIILPLYNQSNWPLLQQLFTDVKAGDPEFAFSLADGYNGRNPDGTYADNSTEAFLAVNCLDYAGDEDVELLRERAEELARAAPVLGPQLAYGSTACAQWPYPAVGEREPIAAAGSSNILVIGTTNDPATPYVWAVELAEQLEHGHLVTYDGEGHTAYNKSNQCVNDVVDAFLVDGTVPASDPEC